MKISIQHSINLAWACCLATASLALPGRVVAQTVESNNWELPLFTMGVFSASCTYLRKREITGKRMLEVMNQHLEELDDQGRKKLAILIKNSIARDKRYKECITYSGLDHKIISDQH
jgi:hypothetical protein